MRRLGQFLVWAVGVSGGIVVVAVLLALAPVRPSFGGLNDGHYAGTDARQARCIQQGLAGNEAPRDVGERCRRAMSGGT